MSRSVDSSEFLKDDDRKVYLDPDVHPSESKIENPTNLGPKIHQNLSHLWLPILQKGMNKLAKNKLIREYHIPRNCPLLEAPTLNKHISAAVSESVRMRDKRRELVQQQLGLGITAINKGLELLLDNGEDRLQAIKYLSDSCRLLCDLHYAETIARRNYIILKFDKSVQNCLREGDRDDTLFGKNVLARVKRNGLKLKTSLATKVFQTFGRTRSPPCFGRGAQKQY